jgi:hypothetical protein
MKESFAGLYSRARDEGAVRSDLEPAQVLALISALPTDPKTGETNRAYLDVVLAGLTRQPIAAPSGQVPASSTIDPAT